MERSTLATMPNGLARPQKIHEATQTFPGKFMATRPHFNIFSWWLPPDVRYRGRMCWERKGHSAAFPLSRFRHLTQTIQYLGVIADSRKMTVALTLEKAKNPKDSCTSVLKSNRITLRDLTKVTGNTVASFLAAKFGFLHYVHLESVKKKKKLHWESIRRQW